MTDKYYVIATNALGKRHYFAGQQENFGFTCLCISQVIFAAYDFETKAQAEACLKDLDFGEKWEVSECNSEVSKSLKSTK